MYTFYKIGTKKEPAKALIIIKVEIFHVKNRLWKSLWKSCGKCFFGFFDNLDLHHSPFFLKNSAHRRIII